MKQNAVTMPTCSCHPTSLTLTAAALPPSGHPALLIPGNAGSFEQVLHATTELLSYSSSSSSGGDDSDTVQAVCRLHSSCLLCATTRMQLHSLRGVHLEDMQCMSCGGAALTGASRIAAWC
jgi:hypothetical protein